MIIQVIALDGMSLMYNEKSSKYYEKKSKTSVCNEILQNYSAVISVESIDISSIEENIIVREECNDIDFIRRLCSEEEKIFYIVDGKAKTEQNELSGVADIELDVNQGGLTQFSFCEAYDNTEFEYRAFNSKDPENELICKAVSVNSEQKSVGNKAQVVRRFIRHAIDKDKLQKIVNEDAKKHKYNLQRANFICIGIPELLPGIKVKIKGITSECDSRSYNVESVIHTFGHEGYFCKVNLSGWCK